MTIDTGVASRFINVAIIATLAAAVGCQNGRDGQPEVAVAVPDEFHDGQTAWRKQATLQPPDNDCLSRFFARNQDLVGSPEFAGQPNLFVSGKNDRRFYWRSSYGENASWRCVHFEDRKFTVTNGVGNPFQ